MNKAKDSARQGASFDKILHIELLLPCVWRGKTRGFSDSQENLGGWDSLTTQSRCSEGFGKAIRLAPFSASLALHFSSTIPKHLYSRLQQAVRGFGGSNRAWRCAGCVGDRLVSGLFRSPVLSSTRAPAAAGVSRLQPLPPCPAMGGSRPAPCSCSRALDSGGSGGDKY